MLTVAFAGEKRLLVLRGEVVERGRPKERLYVIVCAKHLEYRS